MARLRGVELGKEVGYVVRFERHISPRTRIAYVTDGMLERWLTERPALEGVSAVVFDEFHERSSPEICPWGAYWTCRKARARTWPWR